MADQDHAKFIAHIYGVPEGVTGFSLRECCHLEKLPDGWKWYCDGEHPEIIDQIQAHKQAKRQRLDDEDFWNRRD